MDSKSQPFRIVPIFLESKINKKLDELLALDIIENGKSPSGNLPWFPSLKGTELSEFVLT